MMQNLIMCEIRYGGATANAWQRGLWMPAQKTSKYFDSITGGWVGYSHNYILVELFSHALVASEAGHKLALAKIKETIVRLGKKRTGE